MFSIILCDYKLTTFSSFFRTVVLFCCVLFSVVLFCCVLFSVVLFCLGIPSFYVTASYKLANFSTSDFLRSFRTSQKEKEMNLKTTVSSESCSWVSLRRATRCPHRSRRRVSLLRWRGETSWLGPRMEQGRPELTSSLSWRRQTRNRTMCKVRGTQVHCVLDYPNPQLPYSRKLSRRKTFAIW